MSVLSRLTRAATVLAVGTALVTTSAAVASAATGTSPCPAGWTFNLLTTTPHQNVYFQHSAKGPAVIVLSATRTVRESTALPAALPVAARKAIFASLDAHVSRGITPSVTTAGQRGVRYTVPKGQTWFAADILKHWTVGGQLVQRRSNCTVSVSTRMTLQAFQPFAWSHKAGKPFTNF